MSVDAEMVAVTLTDAHGRPGALRLLSHALRQTWRRRENGTLTLAGYRAGGGVCGALTATAERVYTRLGDEGQVAVRDVLLRLVSSEDDVVDVRRAGPVAEG